MKQTYSLILLLCLPSSLIGQMGIYQHGTVVRMHMGDCISVSHGFMVAFGGAPTSVASEPCPEYTLVSDNVVYVIVGRMSNSLIPLAETIDFRLHKRGLAVRVDDAQHEIKFTIKEMIIRSEWERVKQHIDEKMKASEDHQAER